MNEKNNLACSGAQTQHIWRGSQGGQAFKGEAPQADQLLPIAQQKNVKLVLLNITANDLGFSDHVIDCTVAWTLGYTCNAQEQAEIVAALPAAANGLRKAIDEVRAVMSAAGYSTSQYKFLIQGYASPMPVGANIRYPRVELGPPHRGRLPVLRRGRELGQEHGHAHDREQHAHRRHGEGRAVPRRARLAERARGVSRAARAS